MKHSHSYGGSNHEHDHPLGDYRPEDHSGVDDMRHAHIYADGTTWHDHDFEGTHNPAVGLDAGVYAFNAYLEYVRRHSLLDTDAMGKFNALTHDYWSRRLDKAAGVDYNEDDSKSTKEAE